MPFFSPDGLTPWVDSEGFKNDEDFVLLYEQEDELEIKFVNHIDPIAAALSTRRPN